MIHLFFTIIAVFVRLIGSVMSGQTQYAITKKLVAENILLRQQLHILKLKSKKRITFTSFNRLCLAFICWVSSAPKWVANRASVIFSPATLLRFQRHLEKKRYAQLFSPNKGQKRGPKGTSDELIALIIEIKKKNLNYSQRRLLGCSRLADTRLTQER